MLPKSLRITVGQFNKNPNIAIKKYANNFNLFIKKDAGDRLKFVISVPKRLDKRATKRNRTKRIIEQVILSIKNELTGEDQVLIRAKRIITNGIKESFADELKRVLKNEFS